MQVSINTVAAEVTRLDLTTHLVGAASRRDRFDASASRRKAAPTSTTPPSHPAMKPLHALRLFAAFTTIAAYACLTAPALHANGHVDITTATIADLQAAMKKGTLTAEKLTELYFARIAAYDKQGP